MFFYFVSLSFWDLDGAAWVIQLFPMAVNFLSFKKGSAGVSVL
jgi:hypothetical protein